MFFVFFKLLLEIFLHCPTLEQVWSDIQMSICEIEQYLKYNSKVRFNKNILIKFNVLVIEAV